jgi:GntR family transcriptional regulator, arabinose operon transcriptional repressor
MLIYFLVDNIMQCNIGSALARSGMANLGTLKWNQARDQILQRIEKGKYRPGERLPSEQALAEELSVNNRTIRRGLQELAEKGIIEKRSNVGNFVSGTTNRELLTQVAVFLPDYMGHRIVSSPIKGVSNHPVPGMVFNGIAQAFDPKRFAVSMLYYRDEFFGTEVVQTAITRGLKGVILWPTHATDPQEVKRLLDAGIKVVLLSKVPQLSELGLGCVSIDSSTALVQALNGLYDRGHRKIVVGLYTVDAGHRSEINVIDAFCRQKGLGNANDLIENIPNHDSMVHYEAFSKFFERPTLPTAMILPDEFAACEVFRQCYQRNIRIPDDISMVALFDNTPHIHPVPLSAPDSVRLIIYSTELAGQYLIRLMSGDQPLEQDINLRCDIQWKASVGPAAGIS